MNIQGLNSFSALSADGAASPAPGVLGDGANSGLFSAALLEQLAQLQNSLANSGVAGSTELADLQQQLGGLSADSINGATLQDFAALLGNQVPTATKVDQDIDLDDTLQALTDVLQYLQGLETNPAVAPQVALVKTADKETFSAEESSASDLAAQQASMWAGLPAQSSLVTNTPFGADKMLESALATGQAMTALKQNPELPVVDAKSDALMNLHSQDDGGSGSGLSGRFADALATEQGAGQWSQDNAGRGFSEDRAAITLKTQAGNGDVDGSLARLTADLHQMNKTVNHGGNAVSVPGMSTHMSQPGWNTELGEKLLWMHKLDIPSAEIRLNPEHLGPISIKIDVNQDQAVVAFTAQHASVKEAIEAAIPKLREMLGNQNLNLADVNVSQQQAEQRQARESFHMAGEQNRGNNGHAQEQSDAVGPDSANLLRDEIETGRAIAANGLLSLFA